MWQRFTERARKTVFYAQEEAESNSEMYVSTEHILLGLTREPDHVAAQILERLGVTLDQVRAEVQKHVSPGTDKPNKDKQLTPRAKRVIDLAYDEARLLRNNYIGTEHLLLGLVHEADGLAGRVLADMGVKLEECRREVVLIQSEKKPDQADSGELLSMEDAAKFLGVSKPTLYRFLSSRELKGVKVGRQWRFRKEDLAAYLGRETGASDAPSEEIDDEWGFFSGRLELEGQDSSPLDGDEPDGKLRAIANDLIKLAILKKASDIHIEPVREAENSYLLIRVRVDGALHELRRMPPAVGEMLVSRLKAMADIEVNAKATPQEGRIPIQFQSPPTTGEDRISVQTHKQPAFPPKIGSLGEELVKKGQLTEDQLRQARDVQKSAPGDLGNIIVDLGFATERDIASARASEMGLPFVDLTKNYPIDPEAVRLVPEEVARRLNVLPLRRDATRNRLWIAVADIDSERIKSAWEEIQALTKHIALPVLAAADAMKEAIDRAYRRLQDEATVPARRDIAGEKYTIIIQTLPTAHGEAITMRIMEVPKEMTASLDELGFSQEQLLQIRDWIKRPRGMIVGVGPEGSGKITPLYAMLKEIAGPAVKTFAFADPPVEIPYVTPIAVSESTGTMYPETLLPIDALRAMYRGGDPDVVFYDITRDSETARLIVEIGMTGHLVLTTVEAPNLSAAGEKFDSIGPLLLTRALVGVIVQRLAVKICPNCKEEVKMDPRDISFQRIHEMAIAGGYALPEGVVFYRGRGCPECKGRGFRGRVGVFQVITWNDTYSQAVLSGATGEEIERLAVAMGSPTVLADGIRKAADGLITIDEAIRVGSMG